MSEPVASAPARSSRAEGRAIFLVQCVRVTVRLGTAVTLARLLSPVSYGLHGMAAAFFGLLYIARDLGIVTALQQSNADRQHFAALCRLGLFGGLALAATGALLALPAAWFFREPIVAWVLCAMSSALVFSGVGAAPVGLLYRAGRAGAATGIDAIGMIAGSATAIVAAVCGAGVWSLVLLTVVHEGVACGAAWLLAPRPPQHDHAAVNWKSILRFSVNLTAHNVTAYATRILDQVTVGRTAGADVLGLYGRGAQVPALPAQYGIGPFTPWLIAGLARLHADPAEYRRFFRRALNSLLHVAGFSAAICISLPELTLLVLFGEQWLAAAPVVRWLGVVLALQPWLTAPVWLLSSVGNPHRLLRFSIVGLLLSAAGCLVAFPHGFEAIAAAMAVATAAQALIGFAVCRAESHVSARDWLTPAIGPLVVHSLAAAAMLLAHRTLGATTVPGQLAVVVSATILTYAIGFGLIPHLRNEIRHHLFWSR